MSTQDLVAKLWNLCNLLRDDGVTYHQQQGTLRHSTKAKRLKRPGQARTKELK